MKRRSFLQTIALPRIIPLCGAPETKLLPVGKTPALSPDDQGAIVLALGKKGTYKEAQATYNVPLPRNDLKVTVKGEPVSIPFGFGGWIAFKKTWMAGKP
ncbi:DUF1259 domain-containing protein [Spirosoma aerophilum]